MSGLHAAGREAAANVFIEELASRSPHMSIRTKEDDIVECHRRCTRSRYAGGICTTVS